VRAFFLYFPEHEMTRIYFCDSVNRDCAVYRGIIMPSAKLVVLERCCKEIEDIIVESHTLVVENIRKQLLVQLNDKLKTARRTGNYRIIYGPLSALLVVYESDREGTVSEARNVSRRNKSIQKFVREIFSSRPCEYDKFVQFSKELIPSPRNL
jgi:hypothetical protein